MSLWMLDISGEAAEGGVASQYQILQDLNFRAYLEQQGGLAAAAQSFLEEQGYQITDRGGGCGVWDLGVPFDSLEEGYNCLRLLTVKFRKALAVGLVRFSLKTWSQASWANKEDQE